MKTVKLYDLLLQTASQGIELIDPVKGHMPPGHNGLYHDPETPVRNSSHWLITFLKAYEISGEEQFCNAAHTLVEYLGGEELRPGSTTFLCRTNPQKDSCNGLIGQAWVIEALVEAYRVLKIPEALSLAEELFLLHPFCNDSPSLATHRNRWHKSRSRYYF